MKSVKLYEGLDTLNESKGNSVDVKFNAVPFISIYINRKFCSINCFYFLIINKYFLTHDVVVVTRTNTEIIKIILILACFSL